MDKETLLAMPAPEAAEYLSGRLNAGDKFEDVLEELGLVKGDISQAPPYGLGLIKIGNEFKPRPGRGDNGFAW